MKSFEHDGVQLDTGSGYDAAKRDLPRYWLVLLGSKPVDLVRSVGSSNTSVKETVALDTHKRFIESSFFPMQDEYTYQALTHGQFLALCAPQELAKFASSDHFAERGNRHESATRALVIESYEAGRSVMNIASDFGVSRATVYRWVADADYEKCLTPVTHTNP